jgi:hypothetical protein
MLIVARARNKSVHRNNMRPSRVHHNNVRLRSNSGRRNSNVLRSNSGRRNSNAHRSNSGRRNNRIVHQGRNITGKNIYQTKTPAV